MSPWVTVMRGPPSALASWIRYAWVRPSGTQRGGAGLFGRTDQAAFVQQPGDAHFGHGLDDARAADAGDAGGCDVLIEAFLVRPFLGPDDAKAGFLGDRINLYPFNGAGGGALARTDLSALECRAGGRGTGQNAAWCCPAEFRRWCLRRRSVRGLRIFRALPTGRPQRTVGADVACDTGQDIDLRARVHVGQVHLARGKRHAFRRGQRKWRLTQFHGIKPQQ